MKNVILLFSILFACQSQLSAQKVSARDTYNISVTRDDLFDSGIAGYADTGATLFIKIGSNENFNSFTQTDALPKNYTFPVIFNTLPGNPQPVRYVKVVFNNPVMSTGYFPLTTTVGDHTTILPVVYNNLFGYGVDIYCMAPNQYTMMVARFDCFNCPPGGGTSSKNAGIQVATALAPNPTRGSTNLFYTATDKETMSISVTDINGKVVKTYKEDLQAGNNKILVHLENYSAGTYFVKWQSSAGRNGTLKVIKN
jgi:hypothetical protein